MNLDEGAILFQIPRGSAGLQIGTGTIMASSGGATGLIERHSHFYVKVLLLEGEVRVSVPNHIGESILISAGQILITKPDVTSLPDPAHFDIARVMKTCRLVSEFRPLASKDLIEREEQKQVSLTSKGTYIPSNLVIFGRGTLVTLVPPQPDRPERAQDHKESGAYKLNMKNQFGRTPHAKFRAAAFIFSCLILVATSAYSEQLKEAHVTQVVKDVKLLPQQAAPRPAAVNDPVREGTAVRTGTQSRSELTFTDLTITRLGANTIFSFNEGTRTMNLGGGAILFQVPKGSGGATIKTAAVTAAITGTTGIGEFHPATATSRLLSKWLCLEGTFHVSLPDGQSVELGPGKMVQHGRQDLFESLCPLTSSN